jgi:ParB-like chromosome segregation protein Spo0J
LSIYTIATPTILTYPVKLTYGQIQFLKPGFEEKRGKMDIRNSSNVPTETIELDSIIDNVLRLDFYSQSHIEELTKSINKEGLIEALIVHQSTESKTLTMLNGHYRIRSLRRLGFKDAPCRILRCDDVAAIAHYLASFLHKNNMTPLEEGHIILGLITRGYHLEEIGNFWGKSASWACRRVKLLRELDEDIKKEMGHGKIPPRTAQELSRLPQGKDQKRVFKLVIQNQLTKDETAKLIDRWLVVDDNEREQMENEFLGNHSAQKKIYVSSPQDTLKSAVCQCNKALTNLMEYIEHVKSFQNIWPWEEYSILCGQFEKLSACLDSDAVKGRNSR